MTAYALTEDIATGNYALVNLSTDHRFDFAAEDGPLLASMLDDQWPECEHCEDREDVCPACGVCAECRSDDNDCTEDNEDNEDNEDAT